MTRFRIADEGQKVIDDRGEDRLILENRRVMAMDAHRVLGDVALRVDENVEDLPGQALMDDLDRADFHHPMPVRGV